MARAFAAGRRRAAAGRTGQAGWLKDVRNRCADAGCLKNAYRQRIAHLGDLDALAGEWNRFGDTRYQGAVLTIAGVTPSAFGFELSAVNGSHSGLIEGTAVRTAAGAVYTDDESKCVVRFARKADRLALTLSDACEGMGGMGVTFDGEFGKGDVPARTFTMTELGLLAPAVGERAFKALVGDAYLLFTTSFEMFSIEDAADGARLATGGVRGMFDEIGAIVMSRPGGKIMAAVVDGDVVRYFSSDPGFRTKLPPAIERWREGFGDRKVIFAPGR
jgi:hypothetical protein